MAVRRGDIVRVALPGDYGKPRPAVVIQSDLFSELPSTTVLPLTSLLRAASFVRVTVQPDNTNGLEKTSQVMVDKTMTIAREKVQPAIGRLAEGMMVEVERRLALFLGIAE